MPSRLLQSLIGLPCLVVSLSVACAAPHDGSASGAHGTLIVLNKSDATAWLLDATTGERRAELPTGTGPHEVAVSPDGRTAVVCDYGAQVPGNTLTVIDIASATVVATLDLGEHRRPHGIEYLADGVHVVVTSEASRHLLLVDVPAGEVVAAVPTDQPASHMVVMAPDGRRAFVANISAGTVSVLDMESRELLEVVPTGAGAEGIAITPDGREVWVGNRAADTLTVLDARSLEVLAELPSPAFPIRVKITPDGRRALVSNANTGDLAVFDVATREEVGRIGLAVTASDTEGEDAHMFTGFGDSPVPVGILVAPDGTRAWVAATNADIVAEVDLAALRVTRHLATGRQPDGLGWSPLVPPAPMAR